MNKSEAGKLGQRKSLITKQKQKEEKIAIYNLNPNKCMQCGNILSYTKRRNKFCSSSCAAFYNNSQRNKLKKKSKIKHFCIQCGKLLTSRQKKFCSHKCLCINKNEKRIKAWKKGNCKGINCRGVVLDFIRNYLLEKYNYKCAKCGWHEINHFSEKVPLEVHHINGDCTDNREENLIILCPNCHSLTASYKSGNFGKGRTKRLNNNKITIEKSCNHSKEVSHFYCKNCGKEIVTKDAELCVECCNQNKRKVKRPTKEELLKLIKTKSFVQIGKMFGVSDNAIRKWCKQYNLPYRKMDIKKTKV